MGKIEKSIYKNKVFCDKELKIIPVKTTYKNDFSYSFFTFPKQ